jgi:hypothetical protein
MSERRDPHYGSPVYSILAGEHLWVADVLAAEMESGADNARLIAAAPALLDACAFAKAVIMLRNERCSDGILEGDMVAYDMLSAAINKAQGSNQ